MSILIWPCLPTRGRLMVVVVFVVSCVKKFVEKVNEIARRDEGLESIVNIGVIGLVL